jgi:hypothetical protein
MGNNKNVQSTQAVPQEGQPAAEGVENSELCSSLKEPPFLIAAGSRKHKAQRRKHRIRSRKPATKEGMAKLLVQRVPSS